MEYERSAQEENFKALEGLEDKLNQAGGDKVMDDPKMFDPIYRQYFRKIKIKLHRKTLFNFRGWGYSLWKWLSLQVLECPIMNNN